MTEAEMTAFRWATIIIATVLVGLLGYGLSELVDSPIGWKTSAGIAFVYALLRTHSSDWGHLRG